MSKLFFLLEEIKSAHFFKPPSIFFIIQHKDKLRIFGQTTMKKVENDITNIFTSEDIENTPLGFRTVVSYEYCTSAVFYSKALVYMINEHVVHVIVFIRFCFSRYFA